jgi:cobalt-zinc-cadmium efflux system membrane fusion protein
MRHTWLLVLALLTVSGCERAAKEEAPPPARVEGETLAFPPGSAQLNSIKVEPAQEMRAPSVTINGRLTWNEEKTVRIYTAFTGRVARILAQPGDRVALGQTLAIVSSPDFGQVQADSRRAQGDYALAKQNLERLKDLHEHGVAAAKDYNMSQAEFARAESELQRTQARARLYGGASQIDQTYAIKSPIAGTVVERNINPGQELRQDPGSAPALFVITDPSSLWVILDATEKELSQLRPGKTVAIRTPAYRDSDFPARITAIADFLDPTTHTIKVRASLDNKNRHFKGEMFVTADLEQEGITQLRVPSRAVFFQGGKTFVFIDEGSGRFRRREVYVGDATEGTTHVRSGVAAGEKVVTEGALLLQQMLQPRRINK